MAEKVDLVDENDKVIGVCDKDEAHEKKLLHRIVLGIAVNSENKIFIIKRAIARKSGPGLLDASIGGHVSSGESYEQAIKREGKEELGILGDYKFLFKFFGDYPHLKHMTAVYLLKHEGPFILDKEESDEGNWMNYEEIMKIPEEKMTHALHDSLLRMKEMF